MVRLRFSTSGTTIDDDYRTRLRDKNVTAGMQLHLWRRCTKREELKQCRQWKVIGCSSRNSSGSNLVTVRLRLPSSVRGWFWFQNLGTGSNHNRTIANSRYEALFLAWQIIYTIFLSPQPVFFIEFERGYRTFPGEERYWLRITSSTN